MVISMSGWGRCAAKAYRGPDRRGEDRTPSTLGVDVPRRLFWGRAAVVAVAVVALSLGAASHSTPGLSAGAHTYAGVHVAWGVATAIASLGLFLTWRLTGNAPMGLLGAAFAVMSAPRLLLATLELAAHRGDLFQGAHPLAQLPTLLSASWLLVRAMQTPQVDSALRPARLASVHGGVVSALAVAVVIAVEYGVLPPFDPALAGAGEISAAVVGLVLAWAFLRRTRALTRPLTTRLAAVFTGLAIALLASGIGHLAFPQFAVLSGYISLMSVALMATLSVFLLRSVLNFHGSKMLALSVRAASAEETVRREQERMHELRATVAGIRCASGAVTRYQHGVDHQRKQRLEQMMTDELGRLERMLTADDGRVQTGPAMLDDVIRPVVVRHREQGMTLHWRPSGACALMAADAVAKIVDILLTNAHSHAPGAPVDIVVQAEDDAVRILVNDEGPGVGPEVARHLFDRGARGATSAGQGLGLHIARRLATDQGGSLDLVSPATGVGTCFALTLRPAPGVGLAQPEVTSPEDAE